MCSAAHSPAQNRCAAQKRKMAVGFAFLVLGSLLLIVARQDVKPVVEEGGEAVLKISLAQPGSEPVTVRAKSSTLVSK
jgi:hypothetical protein